MRTGIAVIDNFETIKRLLEEEKSARDETKGALAQLLQQIKTDWGFQDFDEANNALEDLYDKEAVASRKYIEAKQVFDKKWENHPVIGPLIKKKHDGTPLTGR